MRKPRIYFSKKQIKKIVERYDDAITALDEYDLIDILISLVKKHSIYAIRDALDEAEMEMNEAADD